MSNYPETITVADALYALDLIKRICTEVGPGAPATPQERLRAGMIKNEMESMLGAANVVVEEFRLAPGAFLGSQLISTLLMLLAAVLNLSIRVFHGNLSWFAALAALVFSLMAILIFIFEFVLGFELVDPLFVKKQSVNVIGRLRKDETQPVKRLLILSGHHDSAYEFTWLRYTGYGYFILIFTWMLGLFIMLLMSSVQLAGEITRHASLISTGMLGWGLLAYPLVPSFIFALFFTLERKNGGTVPGAADNLSACALALAMCRFLIQNPSCIPDETEIRFITFGSEEAGVRGSRRYVQRHLGELKRLDVRLLNFETIAHPEIAILTSESNGTVKNSPELLKTIVSAAQRAGIPYKVQPATLGMGSDAGPFSKAGLKAVTLVGFNIQQLVAFYHQRTDTPEVLTIEPLLNVLKLTFEWLRNGGD